VRVFHGMSTCMAGIGFTVRSLSDERAFLLEVQSVSVSVTVSTSTSLHAMSKALSQALCDAVC